MKITLIIAFLTVLSYYAHTELIDALIDGDSVSGPTSPGKWGSPILGSPGGLVTWSLMPSGVNLSADPASVESGDLSYNLASFMPSGFKTQIENAFAAWSAVANIQFIEVVDNGLNFNASGAIGDIRIGGHLFDGTGGTLAHGFYPPVNGPSAAGDVHFGITEIWVIGFPGPGFDIFQIAVHEIGHAIGLAHTAVPNSIMNPNYSEAFLGPQADDIAEAQRLYGAPIDTVVPEPSTVVMFLIGLLLVVQNTKRFQYAL